MDAPWAADADAVVRALGSDRDRGLTDREADRRHEQFGRNELTTRARPSAWRLFFSQLTNTMTAVLGVAAVVTVAIGEYVDTGAIVVILVLNAVFGFVQEHRAEQAMDALRRLTGTTARVVRDGALREIASVELVPGDVVELAAGDVVPADLRLLDVRGLRVDEAALTGESEPAAKTVVWVGTDDVPALGERTTIAYKGTAVTYGRARGVVVATGMDTEFGRIAQLLQTAGITTTPLQRRLAVLGRRTAAAALVVVATVFTIGVASGEPADDMFLTAVSLAVAAIPEGLPAVVTVALALGARRMATRHALVRKLAAVETLGSVTVICSDKTGTLTENRMSVELAWTPAGSYRITGDGYAPDGSVTGPDDAARDEHLRRAAAVAAACNDAVLHPPDSERSEWTLTGDPTEGALLAFASRVGVEPAAFVRRNPRRAEIAFDATRRLMTTVHETADGTWIAVKGALSALAPLARAEDAALLADAERAADRMTRDGYRVLALADRVRSEPTTGIRLDDAERDLRLLGIVGIADPPRAAARSALAVAQGAGIRTVMITGDDPRTAAAIAERLGISEHGRAVTGAQLGTMTDAQLAAQVHEIAVYARTDPAQKLRIVDAWQSRGDVVAMTGDGVNDAPALQRADIGVAMGITGTDVSKEASDMVLADDNYATIVGAVEEGRRIYDNIRRFVRYLLTTNTGEILIMFVAPLVGLPLPLLPLQILWVNLVTDGLPAVALGLEPAEPDTMARPPRAPDESILAHGLWQHAIWVGALMAAVVIPLQAISRAADWPWQTMVFTTVAFLQLGHALAVRSERESFFRLGVGSNPWLTGAVLVSVVAQLATTYLEPLQRVFDTEALDAPQLLVVLVASTTVFVAVELEKRVRRRRVSSGV
ncbi:MAG TPA: cation-translocating P-type ATPase [Acidimicrobiia bacterium]|nr:cation-translocating P-type ATPase [Acidimicrobiia bacterium]